MKMNGLKWTFISGDGINMCSSNSVTRKQRSWHRCVNTRMHRHNLANNNGRGGDKIGHGYLEL